MTREFCPHCQAVRDLRVTVSRRTVRGADGKPKAVETRTYHCETCAKFVRREDTEPAAPQPREAHKAP